jgi:hypothetical protein
MLRILAGMIVSFAVLLTTPSFAVIVTDELTETPDVETAKVAEDCPEATATEEGIPTLVRLDFKLTVAPFGPANPLRVTVPETACPPETVVGESETPLRAAAVTVSIPDLEPEPDAVIFAVWMDETGDVEIEKVAEMEPAGTLRVAGTVA